jgi:dTDP-4-dehydrorhamnose reductase
LSNKALRLAVTGLSGQIVSALIERAPKNVEIIALGRPHLELAKRDAVMATLRHVRADVIINAAAYTQVDKAESEPDLAMRINGEGAGYVAEVAAELNVPLLHLSTDYVFDGNLDRAYREDDVTNPTTAYGRSKLIGEEKIRQAHDKHIIIRTAWVYSPFGANFVKTMLKLGRNNDEVSIVADQCGNPTSAVDIADALIKISKTVSQDNDQFFFGTFHMSGQGEATWAELAQNTFEEARLLGSKYVSVRRISTEEYPTPADRPKNSRLDNAKLKETFGFSLPSWKLSLKTCVKHLLEK